MTPTEKIETVCLTFLGPFLAQKMDVYGRDARYQGYTTTLIFKDPLLGGHPRNRLRAQTKESRGTYQGNQSKNLMENVCTVTNRKYPIL